jgi:hypothetical protein
MLSLKSSVQLTSVLSSFSFFVIQTSVKMAAPKRVILTLSLLREKKEAVE